jgi:hypothetical protein
MQVVQGLALMGYSWKDFSLTMKDMISLTLFDRSSTWIKNGPDYAVEIATIIYSIASLNPKWLDLTGPLRAAIIIGAAALSDFDGRYTYDYLSIQEKISLERQKYGASRPADNMNDIKKLKPYKIDKISLDTNHFNLNERSHYVQATSINEIINGNGINFQILHSKFGDRKYKQSQSRPRLDDHTNSLNEIIPFIKRIDNTRTITSSHSPSILKEKTKTKLRNHDFNAKKPNADYNFLSTDPTHDDIKPEDFAMAIANTLYGLDKMEVKVEKLPLPVQESLYSGVALFSPVFNEQGLVMTLTSMANMNAKWTSSGSTKIFPLPQLTKDSLLIAFFRKLKNQLDSISNLQFNTRVKQIISPSSFLSIIHAFGEMNLNHRNHMTTKDKQILGKYVDICFEHHARMLTESRTDFLSTGSMKMIVYDVASFVDALTAIQTTYDEYPPNLKSLILSIMTNPLSEDSTFDVAIIVRGLASSGAIKNSLSSSTIDSISWLDTEKLISKICTVSTGAGNSNLRLLVSYVGNFTVYIRMMYQYYPFISCDNAISSQLLSLK